MARSTSTPMAYLDLELGSARSACCRLYLCPIVVTIIA